ncbi:hypothetical protein PUN28_020554 [Cardiocondyla obscurior]|uniref:Uncharacterized protein n=1 Tax=Cardiocondyla obscurior TaxID=286306 RepID=A0AAW2E595_9HYME
MRSVQKENEEARDYLAASILLSDLHSKKERKTQTRFSALLMNYSGRESTPPFREYRESARRERESLLCLIPRGRRHRRLLASLLLVDAGITLAGRRDRANLRSSSTHEPSDPPFRVIVPSRTKYALSRNRQQCASSSRGPPPLLRGLRHNNGERGRRRLSARCENQEVASLAKREPGRNSLKNHRGRK